MLESKFPPIGSLPWYDLEEFRKEGLLVISSQLSFLQIDTKAKQINDRFARDIGKGFDLHKTACEIVHQLRNNKNTGQKVILKEYSFSSQCVLSVRAIESFSDHNIDSNANENSAIFILFIEDKNERWSDELIMQKEKYGLTDRESEVNRFMSQGKTYQDIANLLQISLNTVRFHAKNINLKKRNCLN